MHHMVTGIAPAPMAFKFDPITEIKAELNKDLEKIIIKATQSAAKDRYQRASEMMRDLKSILESRPVQISLPSNKVEKTDRIEKVKRENKTDKKKSRKKKIIPEVIEIKSEKKHEKKLKTVKEKGASHPSLTKMVLIPKGVFWMGDKDCEYDESKGEKIEINRKGQHRVSIPYGYYIDITPVTNIQYKYL